MEDIVVFLGVRKKTDLEELRVQLNIVRNLLQDKVHETFGVNHVYPTQPLGLTLITGEVSSIEYWRPHVDILTYEDTLIHYSAVLYLSSSGQDFTGGSFNRIDYTGGPYQISGYSSEGPLLFTAGEENEHYIEPVLSGARIALAFFFTCDPDYTN
ncbi:2-oxoglutarate and iron-dependent oxygenase domain-containing protein 3 [Eurytemora carolleeae]|uniref:2-oxoglutarate and iron-dependent oxygenase domain-containing protein 3 n=1 Tax=Eurytemora carolleeae TaxID=1294199 RepID=UPI000C784076|nr:2-oxoglutarate and iron-dependent oxygenase domain-containing protein 3 [Eurytemora carolleeae]|eukprot:XP_023332367.1 2-oxoglutarate and iron-dependent oxygenase domain-containing protein 3-like [Eurytemora affinis]